MFILTLKLKIKIVINNKLTQKKLTIVMMIFNYTLYFKSKYFLGYILS